MARRLLLPKPKQPECEGRRNSRSNPHSAMDNRKLQSLPPNPGRHRRLLVKDHARQVARSLGKADLVLLPYPSPVLSCCAGYAVRLARYISVCFKRSNTYSSLRRSHQSRSPCNDRTSGQGISYHQPLPPEMPRPLPAGRAQR